MVASGRRHKRTHQRRTVNRKVKRWIWRNDRGGYVEEVAGDTAGETLMEGCTTCQRKFLPEKCQHMGNPLWGRDTMEALWIWVSHAGTETFQRDFGCG